MKALHPVGTIVVFKWSGYGRVNPHDGHQCEVIEARIKRVNGRNYYKYTLHDLVTNSAFKAEDAPPTSCIEVAR